jgi:uncharacterized membrane protein
MATLGLVGAMALTLALGPTAGAGSDLVPFMGRFHPLAVHLPIGFIILVALGEALTLFPRLRERLDPALGLLLPPLLGAALGAFLLGLLVARHGGYPPRLVALHRGFALASMAGIGVCLVAWSEHRRRETRATRLLYRGALGLTLVLLSLTGHFGGALTHGEGYLTRYAPGGVRRLLGAPPVPSPDRVPAPAAARAEPLVYGDVVAPVLRARCVECHSADTTTGGLRLDDLAELRKGGANGPALVPGRAAESRIMARMMLPPGHSDRMPPEGRPGVTPEQLELIGWWIDRGASETLRVRDALAPEAARRALGEAAARAGSSPAATAAAGPLGSSSGSASVEGGATPAASRTEEPAKSSSTASAVEPTATRAGHATDVSAWQQLVDPLLRARCVSCHGAAKQKGQLRVDSLAATLAGGREGPGIVPGDSRRGTILGRMRLPLEAAGHMPPRAEAQPSAHELDLLAWWVERGASADTPAASLPSRLRGKTAVATTPSGTSAADRASSATAEAATTSAASARDTAVDRQVAAAPGSVTAGASVGAAGGAAAASAVPSVAGEIRLYQGGVAPILKHHCGTCHEGDGASGGLRVDDRAAMLARGSVKPGDPAQSSLLGRMLLPLADSDHMPPAAMSQPSPGEIDVIRLWIAKGAGEDLVVAPADVSDAARAELGAHASPAAPASSTGRAPAVSTAKPGSTSGPSVRDMERVPPTSATGCEACAMAREPAPPLRPLLGASLVGAALLCRRFARRRHGGASRPRRMRSGARLVG